MTCALSWREPSVRLGLRNDSGPEMIASVQSSHISAHVGHFSTPLKSLSVVGAGSVANDLLWFCGAMAKLTRATVNFRKFISQSRRSVVVPTMCADLLFREKEKGSHESIRKAFHTENC